MLVCRENVAFFFRIAAITAAAGLVIYLGKIWVDDIKLGTILLLLQLMMVGALACLVYFLLAIRVFHIEEIRLMYAFVCSKFSTLVLRVEKKGI